VSRRPDKRLTSAAGLFVGFLACLVCWFLIAAAMGWLK